MQKLPTGPEIEEFKEKKKEFDREFQNVLATVAGGSSIEPINIEFEEKPVEEVYKESMENIESKTLQSLLLNIIT